MNGACKKSVCDSLAELERTFEVLSWAIVQGQPRTEQGHALADHYDEAVTDLRAWVRAASNAQAHTQANAQDYAVRRAGLILCQQNWQQMYSRFYCDLVSFERIRELHELGRRKEQQWAGWVRGVRDALGQCHQPLYDLSQALLEAWGELADDLATSRTNEIDASASQKHSREFEPRMRLVRE